MKYRSRNNYNNVMGIRDRYCNHGREQWIMEHDRVRGIMEHDCYHDKVRGIMDTDECLNNSVGGIGDRCHCGHGFIDRHEHRR